MDQIKVSDRERKCLAVLAEYWSDEANCIFFRTIAKETGLDEVQVRRSVRSLARKGLAEYVRGLFNDDGMTAGSGYCATKAGALLINPCKECKTRVSDTTDDLCWECSDKLSRKTDA